MRRDMLQQRQADLRQLLGSLRLETFALQLLSMCQLIFPKTTCGASAGTLGAKWMYLDVEVSVDLDGVTEETDVLRKICEMPHVAQSLQRARFLDRVLDLHLVAGALSGRHRGERA